MNYLILVRHGQSKWNLEKRFTGWVDVDLTGQGKLEACKSGELIKEQNLNFNPLVSIHSIKCHGSKSGFTAHSIHEFLVHTQRNKLINHVIIQM